MSTAEGLLEWAQQNKNRGAQAELAARVAKALGDKDECTRWSLIDLRREFETRAVETRPLVTALSGIGGFLFITPVLLAWYHLHGVFSEFQEAIQLADRGVQVNFLGFWTGAYEGELWAYTGTKASTVALQVMVLVFLVVAVQIALGVLATISSSRDRRLDELVTDASLELSRYRAVRPEELAGEIRVAAQELERGLANLTTAFENTRVLVEEVESFAGAITASAGSLQHSSEVLSTTMAPLGKFGETALQAERALANAVTSLESAERAFTEGVKSNAHTLEVARGSIETGVAENIRAIEAVTSSMHDAATAVSRTSDGLANVVDSSIGISSSVATTARELQATMENFSRVAKDMGEVSRSTENAARTLAATAETADSPQIHTHILALQDVASTMSLAARELVSTVQHMSDQLNQWTANVK